MTQAKFQIRRMNQDEVNVAIDWARKEGWNPGISDAQCFYEADHQGFFVGLLNGEPIATGSAVAYGDHYAFCGLYVVKPEYRGQGYGLQLTQERLKYVGQRITGLDGVLDKIVKYERLGYVSAHKNIRYTLVSLPSFSPAVPEIFDLRKIPWKQLEDFDRNYFPAPRRSFLHCWIHQKEGSALGYWKDEKLFGYGVIRKCIEGFKIGPLFAESAFIADLLFQALCSKIPQGPIYLDVPEINAQAQDLVKNYQMVPSFEVIRMYRNGKPEVKLEGIYGITTYELG